MNFIIIINIYAINFNGLLFIRRALHSFSESRPRIKLFTNAQ